MPLEVDPAFLDSWSTGSGACYVRLDGGADAATAMSAARAAVARIRHPEEPDDPLASFISAVETEGDAAGFWFDAADAEVYEGLLESVLQAVVAAIEASDVSSGTLSARRITPSDDGWLVWLEAVPMPEGAREAPNSRSSYANGGQIGFATDVAVEEVAEFFERQLPPAGLVVRGSAQMAPRAAVALVWFEAGERAGCVEIIEMEGWTQIRLRAYPPRGDFDDLWRAHNERRPAFARSVWRIAPNFSR